MKIDCLYPKLETKVQFKHSSLKLVPQCSGCYVLTSFINDILYIGLSVNLNHRMKQHLENSEKTTPTEDGKSFWFYFIKCDKIKLENIERTWLNHYFSIHGRMPILNKLHSPVN